MEDERRLDFAQSIARQVRQIRTFCLRADEIYRRFRTEIQQNPKVSEEIPREWIPICRE